jgi:hypothetical protein
VRIRGLANMTFCCALVLCATQNFSLQALESSFSYSQINRIHLGSTNVQKYTVCSFPISSESLLQFGQPVVSNSLWFSDLAFKFASTYVKASVSIHTIGETSGNSFTYLL